MKTTVFLLIASVLLLSGTASAVMVGDTRDMVLDELGSPSGYIGAPGRELFSYERGRVVLVDGIVESAELISEEEAVQRRLQREAEEAARLERERERRERLYAEGSELRLRRLADTDFMDSSAAERLAFWKQFRRYYPMVTLGDEYGAALRERELELAAENAAIAAERRLRELEARVARAEADAAYASYEQPAVVSTPVYYGSRSYRGSSGVVYVGSSSCGRSHRGRCSSSCRPSRPKVTPYPSSAGYAFQRPRGNMVGVNVWTGKPVYEKPSCTSRVVRQSRSAHSSRIIHPAPDFVASRPWITSGSTTVVRPASRGGLSVNACLSF